MAEICCVLLAFIFPDLVWCWWHIIKQIFHALFCLISKLFTLGNIIFNSAWESNRSRSWIGRSWEVSCPFLKIEKSALILQKKCTDFGKICLACVHLWVKFSIKMQFWQNLGEKKLFPCGALLFLSCTWNVYRSASIPRNLLCPEKFLVTRLLSLLVKKNYFHFDVFYYSHYFYSYFSRNNKIIMNRNEFDFILNYNEIIGKFNPKIIDNNNEL